MYLDDGGISTAKYYLKVAPLNFYEGDIGASVERIFTRSFSLEAGAGILPFYFNDYLIKSDHKNGSSFNKPHFGLSLSLSPRVRNSLFNYLDFSFPIRARFYFGQLQLYDVAACFGKEWIWNSGFLLDIGIGFGLQYQNSTDKKTYLFDADARGDISGPNSTRFICPINIKFGYRF